MQELGLLLVIGAIGLIIISQQKETAVVAAAGCGGLTGATGAACKKKQSTLYKKPKPIKKPPPSFGTKRRPKKQGITPAPKKAGKGQPPATRKTYEEEVRRTPCRPGESEDSCQRRRLATEQARRRQLNLTPAQKAVLIARWKAYFKARVMAILRARLRRLQSMRTGGYQTVQYGGGSLAGANQIGGALKALFDPSTANYGAWSSQRFAKRLDEARKKCGGDKECFYKESAKIDAELLQETLTIANMTARTRNEPGAMQSETVPSVPSGQPGLYTPPRKRV